MARRGIKFLRDRKHFLKRLSIEKQIALLIKDIKTHEYMLKNAAEGRLDTLDAIAVLKKEQKRSRL